MAGRLGTKHAVEWSDGWLPMDVGLGNVPKKVARFREAAAAAGRALPITLVAWGDPTLDKLLGYRDLGIERVVVGAARVGAAEPRTTIPFIDKYAGMITRLT
jgi:hypothetical protein